MDEVLAGRPANGIEITCRQLTRKFRSHDVLDAIDLHIEPGECCAIAGGNATGKTTLLKCLAGLLSPSRGTVTWSGTEGGNTRPLAKLELRKRLGIVSHATYASPYLTVRENLKFAARMHALHDPATQVSRAITHAQLEQQADQSAGRLSRGFAQRLAIAMALIHNPSLVILDEPDTGLDQAGLDWLFHILQSLKRQDRTLIVATHRGQWIAQLEPRVLEICLGKLCELTAACRIVAPCDTAAA
jgi:ABC-type multidrug transport system ATPase subunit